MLTLEKLECRKNDRIIFCDLSFTTFTGSSLIIKGKNGSGKTSLLKIIAGISKESKGNISWNNQNIKEFRSDFNADIQFIGHKNFFKPELTILENIRFYAKIQSTEYLIEAALKFFKIEEYANFKIKNLSAGLIKKAQLSRLLACPATIWILDEPSTNLDEDGKKLLQGLIETHAENQGISIIATHDNMFFNNKNLLNIEDFAIKNIY